MARRWIVDGNNVMGARPDGWWRDRAGATRRLVGLLDDWARRAGEPVLVVFDGRPVRFAEDGTGVEVAFATRSGPDAADDDIARLVEEDEAPADLVVVTSDARLAERARARGARVEGAGAFRRQLEGEG